MGFCLLGTDKIKGSPPLATIFRIHLKVLTTLNRYTRRRSETGHTILIDTNLFNSQVVVPRMITWNDITFPANWQIPNAVPARPIVCKTLDQERGEEEDVGIRGNVLLREKRRWESGRTSGGVRVDVESGAAFEQLRPAYSSLGWNSLSWTSSRSNLLSRGSIGQANISSKASPIAKPNDSPYYIGLDRVSEDFYDSLKNPNGIIQLGLVENRWFSQNFNDSILRGGGEGGESGGLSISGIVTYQPFHEMSELKEANDYQVHGSGRAQRGATAHAMQGWHVQCLIGYGEVGEPIIKDKNFNNMPKREKVSKASTLVWVFSRGLLQNQKQEHCFSGSRLVSTKSRTS
ncbi:uncharacterized protein LOC114258059 [Camellia sinensis]|uniref:uncharacterized protein LOC114258059 n=1 Tax=Camellia sinensis TaxID=4442 RepID=UPI001036A70F|nr:uncharacterized protein LOC114258059 [Camellia sinensis]